MNKVEFAHEAADVLEMYGHLLRKLDGYCVEYDSEGLRKVHNIMKNHRQKMIYILDKAYNSMEEK